MYKCEKTNRTFSTSRGLINHLRNIYNNIEEAYIFEVDSTPKKCIICNDNAKFKNFKEGFLIHCGNRKCIKKCYVINNTILGEQRKQSKIKMPIIWVKKILQINIQDFKKTNIELLGVNIGNITLNQYLSKHFYKFQRSCKYCGSIFEIPFNNLSRHHCTKSSCTQLYKNHYFNIRNKMDARELNNKWFELNKIYGKKIADDKIKEYMKSSEDFDTIFNSAGVEEIQINNWNFMRPIKSNNLLKFIKKNIDKCYWYDLVYKKCLHCNMQSDVNLSLTKQNMKKFCSHKCYIAYKIAHPEEFKYSEATKMKQSIMMKDKIYQGVFTPNTTNSWCNSRVYYNNIAFRSSWEFLFYILNESADLLFEELRIPYYVEGIYHNYIVDFINYNTHMVYEIKPNSEKNTLVNQIKKTALMKWCDTNKFTYNLITDDYFKAQHINEKQVQLINELNLNTKLKQFL